MAQAPSCTSITFPGSGEINFDVDAPIRWAPVANATAYTLFIGKMPGSWDVVDGVDLENTLSYAPPSGWEANTTYYVMVLPRNNSGAPPICEEESFTTGVGDGIPACVQLQQPLNGAYGVPPDIQISWFPRNQASGYLLSIGTSTGAYDILDNEDVGNVTTYDLPDDLPGAQRIYIKIIPYNMQGESPACSELSFRTRNDSAPLCTEILDPADGTQFVSVTANITWIRNFNASGYIMTIEEKSLGGIRIVDNEDVGTGTNFKPPNFLPNTTYYVTLSPYNDLGVAQNCTPISFTTGEAPDPPECGELLMPSDGATGVDGQPTLVWGHVAGARGYLLSAGTSAGNNNLLNREDMGYTDTYTFPENLPVGARIYIRLIPYSEWGEAEGCTQWVFTIDSGPQAIPTGVPGFFTPNNDGFNDTWLAKSSSGVTVGSVWIFNRFGQLIKQLHKEEAWDGTYNGRPVASDTYWYRIETLEGRSISGFILLKR